MATTKNARAKGTPPAPAVTRAPAERVLRLPADGNTARQIIPTRHLDVQLSGRQAEGLARLLVVLHGREMPSGRFIQTSADALRWLLDAVAAAMDPTTAVTSE